MEMDNKLERNHVVQVISGERALPSHLFVCCCDGGNVSGVVFPKPP